MKPRVNTNSQKGVVGVYLAIIVVVVTLGIVTSIVTVTLGQQRIVRNITQSAQAYYAAEAGAEDALLRLQNSMSFTSPYVFPAGTSFATVTISSAIGGVRTIEATGDATKRFRKVKIVYQIDSTEVSFNFGAQIGDGGMEMRPNSQVTGNVFSNGTIFGSGTITETAIVAGNGNKIDGSALTVKKDAQVHTCKDATIEGDLTVVSGALGGGNSGCTVLGSILPELPNNIDPVNFPITSIMIADWKSGASNLIDGGGDVTISANRTLGPGNITGDLTIDNGVTLTLTGTLWITGNMLIENLATVKLDTGYGDLSGALIVDGLVDIDNNVILEGTSDPKSFLIVIGTNPSTAEIASAMDVKNQADGAILFTPNGLMVIHNGVNVVEASAYQLLLINNATVTYDVGLANARFTSGPSGGWTVTSWKEIQ